ncbi:MAG TPA: hypothetical protein VKA21_07045, partial [Candidatus Binatia bacterium]|nr:hypothetical protein [Candidatus Binatia bacterium]
VRQAMTLYYGALDQSQFGTASGISRCQRTIGKETTRFLAAKSKALAKCWDARLKGKHTNACPTPGDGRAAGAIARAELRKRSRICSACGGPDSACSGGNDLTRAQIGFVASCPAVTVPGGASCAASIADASDVVDCVDCVSEFKVDCTDRLAVPALAAYPPECNGGPGSTTSTTGTTPTTTTTGTVTTTTTTSTPPPTCPPPPIVPLGSMTFTINPGTTDCGGQGLAPGPVAPFSGEVTALDGSKRSDLGLGCLYVGDGANNIVPGAPIADGGSTVLDVAGVSGLAITVTASDGSGPADCSKGAGPSTHCLNGKPGTDTMGACDSDADCAGLGSIGACAPDANCYFGTPLPLPLGGLTVCIVNVVANDVCGTANLLTQTTTVSAALDSRIYLTLNPAEPCPRCVANVCTAGERQGLSCSGGLGIPETTSECLPKASQFFGRLNVNLASLSTGTSVLAEPSGNLCAGQVTPGFVGGEAKAITETGAPLFGGLGLFDTTLAGTFCVPATGNVFFDSTSGLPGPGAVSVPGTVEIDLLP